MLEGRHKQDAFMNSISFGGSILWNSTSDVIKSSNTVFAFIKTIKKSSGEVCNCNICT